MKNNKTNVYVYCDPRYTNKGRGYKYKFGSKGKIKLKYKPFYIGAAKGETYKRHLIKGTSSRKRSLSPRRENGGKYWKTLLREWSVDKCNGRRIWTKEV